MRTIGDLEEEHQRAEMAHDQVEEIARLKNALRFYADVKKYSWGVPCSEIDEDQGEVARKALGDNSPTNV